MYLPYWRSELDIEAGECASVTDARRVVSMARLHSPQLEELSRLALAAESELLYVWSAFMGLAGSMLWEETLFEQRFTYETMVFTLVLAYSPAVEKLAADCLERVEGMRGGVTECTFRVRGVPKLRYRVVAVVADQPFVDGSLFVDALIEALKDHSLQNRLIPYYAEKMGVVRSPVALGKDGLRSLAVTDALESFELEATRTIVGPAPSIPLPLPLFPE